MSEPEAQSNKSIKFCTDCEYIATSSQGWEYFKCRADKNKQDSILNVVNGEQIITWHYNTCKASRQGEFEYACTVEAKWFKQKEYAPSQDTSTGVGSMKGAGKKQITLDMI